MFVSRRAAAVRRFPFFPAIESSPPPPLHITTGTFSCAEAMSPSRSISTKSGLELLPLLLLLRLQTPAKTANEKL